MTLLEVLLTLALMAIVITLLGVAIDFHLRVVDVRRTRVEQAQLARAVLRMMANDIRATVQSEPVDFSSVQQLATGTGLGMDDLGDLGDLGGEIDPDEVEQSLTDGIEGSVAAPSEAGLYGNQYELRIDVSRLPRPDPYAALLMTETAEATDIPSEIKSVAYYVLGGATGGNAAAPPAPIASAGQDSLAASPTENLVTGLVRRSLSRAAAQWAGENGNLDTLLRNTEVVAPEVAHLEFRYFDGTEWLFEWDTAQEGGLPVAVEVGIWIQSPDEKPAPATRSALEERETTRVSGDVYRLIVDLPLGRPTTDEDEQDTASQEVLP
jgi:hypothetical protein